MLFLRAAPVLLLALSVVYVSLYFYLRATYRDRLLSGHVGIEPGFIEARVDTYAARMRWRLAWIVFGIPTAVLAAVIFLDIL